MDTCAQGTTCLFTAAQSQIDLMAHAAHMLHADDDAPEEAKAKAKAKKEGKLRAPHRHQSRCCVTVHLSHASSTITRMNVDGIELICTAAACRP